MSSTSDGQHDHQLWSSFVQGLTQPSWTALLSTLLFAVISFAVLTSMTLEELALANVELFRTRGLDDSTLDATVRSLELRRDRHSPVPALLLIGDKQWGRNVEAAIAKLDIPHLRVIDLTTTEQTLFESEALIDWTSNRTGVVIVDASLKRFFEPESRLKRLAAHPKLGFRSRAFDREIETAGLPTRSLYDRYLLDNVSFFVDRWPNAMLNVTLGKPSASGVPEVTREHTQWRKGFDIHRTFECNKKAFGRFMEIATRKTRFDIIVIAMDSPGDPAPFIEQRNKLIANLANSSRVHVMSNDSHSSTPGRDGLVTLVRKILDQKNG